MDEQNGLLYLIATKAQSLNFPQCDTIQTVKGPAYSYVEPSQSGKYVALNTERGAVAVYRTSDFENMIFQKKWRNPPVCGEVEFWGEDEKLLISIQDKVYALDLNDPSDPYIIYGDDQEEFSVDAWHRKGYVVRISVFKQNILILHRIFGNKACYRATLMKNNDDNHPVQIELPSLYNIALLDHQGGICLFDSSGIKPMLHFRSFSGDFQHPDEEVQLPGNLFPSFSRNGKYLSVYEIPSVPGKGKSAWLIDTSNWQIVDEVTPSKNNIWSTGFSNQGNYWLVSSDRPMVISVPE